MFMSARERKLTAEQHDRKIPDYFQHLFNREPSKSVITGANKQKSFYEDLVQIGTKDDTGVGTPDAEIAVACLKEYMEDFQERNPNFYVFNAVMHLDEATPHLHIDYIPLGHFFNGLEKRNAMARALEEMGYGKGANAINRWRLSEWKVLHDICTKHGFEISEPKKSRGYSFTTAEYGEYKDTIKALEEEKAQAENERDEAQAELKKIAQKRVKLDDIDKLDTGKTMFGGKVTVAKDDWENITALAKREVTSTKQVRKLKKERDEAVQKYDELKDKRVLKISPYIMGILKELKDEQDEEALRLGDKWVESDRLFVKWNGEPMNNQTPYGWLKEFCEKNDMPFYGIHSFRHFAASALISSGLDVVTVSGALGHCNSGTTLNVYAHMFQTAQARVAQAMDGAFSFLPQDSTR